MRGLTKTRAALALTVVAVALASLVGAGGAAAARQAPKSQTVTVNDFFFGPTAVTIREGGTVKWVWSSANTAPHDVVLKQGPKNLKEKGKYSTKTTATTGARFQKSFPRTGTYKYICTIHPTEMKMTVTVKK